MADLTTATDRDRSRGQIILVAAFILAVSFVVLALVVNSAIFTENLATRAEVPGSTDALEYRAAVEASVGDLIVAANENESRDKLDVENSVENLSSQGGFGQSVLGRVVNVSYESWEPGIRIGQNNASRNFTSNDSDVKWDVVENVEQTRNFRMNITNPNDAIDFTLDLPSTDGSWTMEVSSSSGSDIVDIIIVTDAVPPITCARDSNGDPIEIDITGGTFGGEPCFALDRDTSGTNSWFATGLDEYDINFTSADSIEGTYSFVVNDTSGVFAHTSLVSGQDPDFPYVEDTDIVYSMNVSFAYYTPSVGYETEIRAAPGEAPP